jgi:hypothetical protein
MMASHSDAHAHEHPGPGTYGIIALILTVITVIALALYGIFIRVLDRDDARRAGDLPA